VVQIAKLYIIFKPIKSIAHMSLKPAVSRYFYLFVLLTTPVLLFAQADTSLAWAKLLGGAGLDHTHCSTVEPTKDGGYIVAGATFANDGDVSGNHGKSDAWVVKLTAGGTVDWQKCFGGSDNDFAQAIKQTADGGYIIAASTTSNDGDVSGNHGGTDVWMIKTDGAGNIQWQKCFGGSNNDIPHSLLATADKGYIFTAGTNSADGNATGIHADTSYWCVKLDSIGSIEWKKYFNGAAFSTTSYAYVSENNPSEGFSYTHPNGSFIQSTADKGFIILAESDEAVIDNHGGLDYLVLKLDSAGNTEWEKSFGDSADNIATCIRPVTTGGYIVTGNTFVASAHITPPLPVYLQIPWIIKLDESGNIQWQKLDSINAANPGFSALVDNATSVVVAPGGDYIMCGYASGHYGLGGSIFGWLTRFDSLGNVRGITYPDGYLYSAGISNDGSFIAAGDAYPQRGFPESTYVASICVAKYKASLLPVSMLNFTGAKTNGDVLLRWQTASEINSSYFNVQRSTDASRFITVGKVGAAGNATVINNYHYTDYLAKTGGVLQTTLYYRLQEVDKDGKIITSKIVRINPENKDIQLEVLPNPVHNMLNLRIRNYTGKTIFTVVDMAGHIVWQLGQQTNNTSNITLNITGLAAGTYIISATMNGKKVNEKFVKE